MTPGLTEFAAEQQRHFDESTSASERKTRGHFGTPSAIANFMANKFSELPRGTFRIVDAGAGVGMLSAAICQRTLGETVKRSLFFELWENDLALQDPLCKTMDYCQKVLSEAGHEMVFTVRTDDFILANRQESLFDDGVTPSFHRAILNPPYFKL